ncbi:MAG: DUF3768 domain-containing protein [Pseudomonadota bacterium]
MTLNLTPERRIALQNDLFRMSVGMPIISPFDATGTVVVTREIASLSYSEQAKIINAVRCFDTFTLENDPWGEHDFGRIELPGLNPVLWKIDIYDSSKMRFASPAPEDPNASFRVLTIMFADQQ